MPYLEFNYYLDYSYLFCSLCFFVFVVRFKCSLQSMKSTMYIVQEDKINSTTTRGQVTSFSNKSKRRLETFLFLNSNKFKAFLTLTTLSLLTNAQFKNCINRLQARLKEFNIANVWVVELQARGALHLHMLLTDTIDWTIVSATWNNAQGRYTKDNIYKTCSNIKKFVPEHTKYLLKYLEKGKNSDFTGRRWGYSDKGNSSVWQLPHCIIYEKSTNSMRNDTFAYDLVRKEIENMEIEVKTSDYRDMCFVNANADILDILDNHGFEYQGTKVVL